MKILCPVKKTVWGPINNRTDLDNAIRRSGQPFGVDWSGPACNYNSSYPCNISLYAYKGWGLHTGIDLPVVTGTEIYSATDGIVDRISDDISQGIGVVIWDKIQKIKTVYWHLKNHIVRVGDSVKVGQLIAYSDNTGYSAGPHLHFEVKTTTDTGSSEKAIDPMGVDIFFQLPAIIETMKITKELLPLLYKAVLHREPDTDFWVEHDVDEFLRDTQNQVEWKKLDLLITDARNLNENS